MDSTVEPGSQTRTTGLRLFRDDWGADFGWPERFVLVPSISCRDVRFLKERKLREYHRQFLNVRLALSDTVGVHQPTVERPYRILCDTVRSPLPRHQDGYTVIIVAQAIAAEDESLQREHGMIPFVFLCSHLLACEFDGPRQCSFVVS